MLPVEIVYYPIFPIQYLILTNYLNYSLSIFYVCPQTIDLKYYKTLMTLLFQKKKN